MTVKKCLWVIATSFLLPVFAWSQTIWPDFMPTLVPGQSQSPVAAVVPPNSLIETPSADVPADKARWSGIWAGWLCRDKACDTKLVVEKVTAEGATIVYAFASSNVKPYTVRLEGKFIGDELQATLENGARLAYRMRNKGDLEFIWRKGDQWYAGVLAKVN